MSKRLRAGDQVQVRTAEEILATLDDSGRMDGLPFMPEMLAFLGQSFRVYKRAHKTCDTVHQTGGRKLKNCVHLEGLRCDGQAHDGCDALCLLFWNEAWLRRLPDAEHKLQATQAPETIERLTELVRANTRRKDEAGETIYACQATALYEATQPLRWWQLGQYVEDLTSGNVSLGSMLRVWFFHGLHKLMRLGVGYRLWRNLYDRLQPRFGGYGYPYKKGKLPKGSSTPAASLNLEPGEWVRIKSHEEILETVTTDRRNRGMSFDQEMVPYCGSTAKVAKRVGRIIHETTGKMIEIKSPSVILEGVVCRSELSNCRLFCPRAIPSYWRDVWLERESGESMSAG